jgi:hypothetical protein
VGVEEGVVGVKGGDVGGVSSSTSRYLFAGQGSRHVAVAT